MINSSQHIDKIRNDQEYYDLSERLRILYRTIVQLVILKEEYEARIAEYLEDHIENKEM